MASHICVRDFSHLSLLVRLATNLSIVNCSIVPRSISTGSNTVSMTTNNIGDASIQDLLSNTSIHRMHTVAESVSNNMEEVSHVSISLMNENEDGFSLNPSLRTQSLPNGDVHSRVSAPSLQRRASYGETIQEEVRISIFYTILEKIFLN